MFPTLGDSRLQRHPQQLPVTPRQRKERIIVHAVNDSLFDQDPCMGVQESKAGHSHPQEYHLPNEKANKEGRKSSKKVTTGSPGEVETPGSYQPAKKKSKEGLEKEKNMSEDRETCVDGEVDDMASSGGSIALRKGKQKKQKGSKGTSEGPPAGQLPQRMDSTISLAKDVISQLNQDNSEKVVEATQQLYRMVDDAWSTPKYGRDLACSISDALRVEGGLDVVLANCKSVDRAVQLNSARLLEQIMTAENRDYVAKRGLGSVVRLACSRKEPTLLQIGMGILENLFKHSEETCTKVIDWGGLQAVIYGCRMSDNITLRHCASALANCAMYGGPANQQRMIEFHASEWLFPLAFNNDNSIRYYACLAIAVLAANQDIERAVATSGTLDLVEPFVSTHDPGEFGKSDKAHSQGRSEGWLMKLMPLLSCHRREAQCLAAFHFAMEAIIKKEQNRLKVFYDICVIPSLQRLASSNNDVAAKQAIMALRTIGEEIPAKLSFNISSWTVKEVQMWLKNIGFGSFSPAFEKHKVDGDLLITITEEELRKDAEMESSLLRRRFLRELALLKINTCSGDWELKGWLKNLGPEYQQYTHNLMHCGINLELLPFITEDHLCNDAGITNGVHRMKILRTIRPQVGPREFARVFDSPTRPKRALLPSDQADMNQTLKNLDVFISYRRATGSLLASLLKVHLQLRNFTVFIDVEKLEAGKFDNNLLNSIRNAHNFVLVLSTSALDRCKGDVEYKDWVHREIVTALESKCNIIPVMDNFRWPKPEELPEDMRAICYFNGIKWIHDYQDACIDKLERFLRGEENMKQYLEGTVVGLKGTQSGHGLRNSRGNSHDSNGSTG